MEYTIRKAQKKDIEDIMRLLKQIAQLHYEGRPDLFKTNASKYSHEMVHFKIKNPDEYIVVAIDETDKVLGYIFCYFEIRKDHPVLKDRKVIYIDDFCVDQEKRELGIGSKLFTHIENYAKQTHCDAIELNVWVFNKEALRFYEKHGLLPKSTRMELLLDQTK